MAQEYEKEIAEIKSLADTDLAKLRVWQVTEKAIPYGLSGAVAENLEVTERAVQSWRVNPDLQTGSLSANDPSGRRGPGHHFNLMLVAVNAVFPPGAQLLLRWQRLKLGNGQSIKDYNRMEAILALSEELRAFGEEIDGLQAKRRALQEKMTSIISEWTDNT